MRLLKREGPGDFRLTPKISDKNVPPYAILSHTWGCDEVLFEDLEGDHGRNKTGYQKIEFCGEQAARDNLHYFWVDTCCIRKSSDAEQTSALNSMFRWYRKAAKCYVYLSDVSACIEDNQRAVAFRKSRWFTRGWTLPELLAPESVEFFSKEGVLLGDKKSLMEHIFNITGIPVQALRGDVTIYSMEQRISWIDGRETEEEEDKAYCLIGICDVSLAILYGEGEEKAFRRLRREIELVEQDKREETWSMYLVAGEREEVCWNCGSRDYWESRRLRLLCGKCEKFLKCQTDGIILSADARSAVRAYYF